MNAEMHKIWMDANSGSLSEFQELVGQSADPKMMPRADRIANNVPIYSGDMIRNIGTERKDLMAEWGPCINVWSRYCCNRGRLS